MTTNESTFTLGVALMTAVWVAWSSWDRATYWLERATTSSESYPGEREFARVAFVQEVLTGGDRMLRCLP